MFHHLIVKLLSGLLNMLVCLPNVGVDYCNIILLQLLLLFTAMRSELKGVHFHKSCPFSVHLCLILQNDAYVALHWYRLLLHLLWLLLDLL